MSEKAASELPKAKSVIDEVSGGARPSETSEKERQYADRFGRDAVSQQVQYAHLTGIRDHYRHKGRWSNFLIAAIAAMLLFQSFLLYKVGKGHWVFVEYEWLLPALLVQNLAQVVGLAVWAVKYLFSDISNQTPK
jgi:hypothetical protein